MRRFIRTLNELLEPFHKLLKKNVLFNWNGEQQATFRKIKDVLRSHLIMISPFKGLLLTLYLISVDKSISALLAQKVKGVYHLVYLSRSIRGAELNYPSIKYHYLAVAFTMLRHYILDHSRNLATKSNPLILS